MRALAILLLLAALAPVPGAAATCTFANGAYACTAEEADDCGGFSAVGAGAGGVAGVAVAGFDTCESEYVVVSASASSVFVNLLWQEGACSVVAAGQFAPVPCDAAPPNPGWGRVLP